MHTENHIRHLQPDLRKMILEYHLIYSNGVWKVLPLFVLVSGILLAGFYLLPSAADESVHWFLRIPSCLDLFFLIFGIPIWILMLLAPLFSRVLLPLIIMALETVYALCIFFPQSIINGIIDAIVNAYGNPTKDSTVIKENG